MKKMKKHSQRAAAAAAAAAMLAALVPCAASAAPAANPVISRGCPAYAGTNPATASAGCDAFYYSFWNGSAPDDYLAYDLSGVPAAQRQVIDLVWYNTSAYDVIGMYVNRNQEPSDYTIEVNAAPGGTYPEDGWVVVDTVAGNTLSSRQHVVDFDGYNWIRFHLTGVDEKTSGTAMINMDIHDVSNGVQDSWLFLGDSITAMSMNNCYGTGFATFVSEAVPGYFPIQQNGGIGGITSKDGRENIDRWLDTFPGRYVSIAYGTNDAWGDQTGAEQYYENTVYMVEAVLARGMVPVVGKIPASAEPGVADNLEKYNAMIDRLWEAYPQVVQGPDLYAFFTEHPDYLGGDGVHPTSDGQEAMRQYWAQEMAARVYAAEDAPAVVGDVDGSGAVGLTDIVMLQRYLLGMGQMTAPQNSDVYADGVTDVLDLGALKRLFTSQMYILH